MYKFTFVNTSDDKRTELKDRAIESLESRAEDFRFYMENESAHSEGEPDEWAEYIDELIESGEITEDEADRLNEQFYELPAFHEYGLCFDFVEEDDHGPGYYRYQLSTGGPGEEIRFYPDRVEFVFLDWFVGAGISVTGQEWAEWLKDYFTEIELINFPDTIQSTYKKRS